MKPFCAGLVARSQYRCAILRTTQPPVYRLLCACSAVRPVAGLHLRQRAKCSHETALHTQRPQHGHPATGPACAHNGHCTRPDRGTENHCRLHLDHPRWRTARLALAGRWSMECARSGLPEAGLGRSAQTGKGGMENKPATAPVPKAGSRLAQAACLAPPGGPQRPDLIRIAVASTSPNARCGHLAANACTPAPAQRQMRFTALPAVRKAPQHKRGFARPVWQRRAGHPHRPPVPMRCARRALHVRHFAMWPGQC